MWRQKARSAAPRFLAGVSAVILTGVTFYSAAIAVLPQQGPGMTLKIWLLLAFMAVGALSSWLLMIGREDLPVRLVTNLSAGFNLIWIFSSFGPPVGVAIVLAAGLATIPAPRRLLPVLIGAAVAGLCLGLLVLRLQ